MFMTVTLEVFPNCMVGSEMVDWLLDVSIRLSASGATLSRFQVGGMWQALLEYDVIHHGQLLVKS